MFRQAERVALVVEGVEDLTRIILGALTKDDVACRVVLTNDGAEALDYLLGRGDYALRDLRVMPCVVLLDLSLAGSDGLGLIREMRGHERTRRLPVVAFSSAAGERQGANAVYAAGANSFIGIRPGFGRFEEALGEVARYWCVLNEPPPAQ